MKPLLLCAAISFSLFAQNQSGHQRPSQTALDRYVAAPDSHYSWKLVDTVDGGAFRAYVLELTSQQYLTEKEVDRPIWKHWLTVIRPPHVNSSTGFLFITGGNNRAGPPTKPEMSLVDTAVTTKSIVSELRMVPNQPLKFSESNRETSEDASIAYTWDKFLKTGDEKWPMRLPMTKAAVRAMDAIQEFSASEPGGQTSIEKFVVAGGSKRGWTTWTTAAVDKRVTAIIPLVIDLLNIEPSFIHHWRAYGFWAPAIQDYLDKDIMDWGGTKEYKALMKIEEPFEYRDRLTMPKYIVNATGDQFFLPDSSQFYWDELQGEKHLRYVPNVDHSLRGSDAQATAMGFYDMILRNQPRPKYSWKIEGDRILVECQDKPTAIKLWRAENPEKRDFRVMTIGPAYQSEDIALRPDGKYEVNLAAPAKGWSASFVELTYPSGGKYPFKVTTGVKVLPDKYPFPAPANRGSGR
jgi:PhoPQ-activated pathogenicity-related protein